MFLFLCLLHTLHRNMLPSNYTFNSHLFDFSLLSIAFSFLGMVSHIGLNILWVLLVHASPDLHGMVLGIWLQHLMLMFWLESKLMEQKPKFLIFKFNAELFYRSEYAIQWQLGIISDDNVNLFYIQFILISHRCQSFH